ncbi:putative dual specificity protein phosphatase DSP8 [Camellia lanceoleosa]|uniref:Dual specificity protein phosphatase DSP8 n=1 Tax=Camellia lanceoleosa TaxID=1840588 RepID=A0ACC0FHY6_9ERIC|nr:putative dual specificity protein phosphatase DSP8 [Camellia lanceoleosa]
MISSLVWLNWEMERKEKAVTDRSSSSTPRSNRSINTFPAKCEELKGGEQLGSREEEKLYDAEVVGGSIVVADVKRAEFRWWDWVDECVLLGAIPFPVDVERLKDLGVCEVITLTEPYETLVPTSLYQAHGINHLVLSTRDYLFAPSLSDICQAVYFIHENASCGRATYVHCKAGRGHSTTIVLCYLAVQEFYHHKLCGFDNQTDLVGYDPSHEFSAVGSKIWTDLSLVCRIQVTGQAALAKLSCLWLRCHTQQKVSSESSCRITADQLRVLSADIHVF